MDTYCPQRSPSGLHNRKNSSKNGGPKEDTSSVRCWCNFLVARNNTAHTRKENVCPWVQWAKQSAGILTGDTHGTLQLSFQVSAPWQCLIWDTMTVFCVYSVYSECNDSYLRQRTSPRSAVPPSGPPPQTTQSSHVSRPALSLTFLFFVLFFFSHSIHHNLIQSISHFPIFCYTSLIPRCFSPSHSVF